MKIKIFREGSYTDAIDQMIGSDLDGSGIDDSLRTAPPKGQKRSPTKPKIGNRDTRPRHQRILEDDKGYQVKKELGSGMYGSVFLAVDPNGREVAIKIMHEGAIGDMAVNKEMSNYQTVQKARKQSKLIAKHFPKVFNMFKQDRYGFIVMELLTNKGAKMSMISDIFQGIEGRLAPTADAIEQGAYKNVRRRMYSFLVDDKARNKLIANLLNGVDEKIIERAQAELSHLPFLQHQSLVPDEITPKRKKISAQIYKEVVEDMEDVFLYTARDAFVDGPGELKKEYLSNPGLLVFITKLVKILREEDITQYWQRNIGIAMAWTDFVRKGSPIGVHNRPELALQDRGGADPEIGDAIGEAASIRKALEELEKLTGLAGRDMHDKNAMIREYTGDIVIVDLGLFKPRSEVVEERKKKRKKRRKKRRSPRRAVGYYGMGYGYHDYGDSGGDFGGDGGGGDGKRDDKKKIKIKIVKNLKERCQKGYKTHPTRKTKKMFGKQYRNCVKAEGQEKFPEKVHKKANYIQDKEGKKKDQAYAIAINMHKDGKLEEADPAKGTGKKPKGSGRRLYTDEDPSDTVSVSFKSVSAIQKTLSKKSFKSKSHKRQSQIINLIHQRARAAYQNAKDPKVKARLKKAYEYAEKRKEASKKKTIQMRKDKK